jgi:hypothetical protein
MMIVRAIALYCQEGYYSCLIVLLTLLQVT